MKNLWLKGSYTIEASIWISMVLCMMMTVLRSGISFYMECRDREVLGYLAELDMVTEFYNYQNLKELGDMFDD